VWWADAYPAVRYRRGRSGRGTACRRHLWWWLRV